MDDQTDRTVTSISQVHSRINVDKHSMQMESSKSTMSDLVNYHNPPELSMSAKIS